MRSIASTSSTSEDKHSEKQATLAEHVDHIRALGKQTVANIVEIGRRLVDCRDNHLQHGQWLPWLDREFGWSRQTADRFIHIYNAAGKLPKLSNLNLPVSSLYLIAAPSTPAEARDEVLERVHAGETLPVAEVKHVVEKHKGNPEGRKKPAAKKAEPREAKPAEPKAADAITSGIDQTAAPARTTKPEATCAHDLDFAEQLQAAKIQIVGLESEVKELKAANAKLAAENDQLRTQLDAASRN